MRLARILVPIAVLAVAAACSGAPDGAPPEPAGTRTTESTEEVTAEKTPTEAETPTPEAPATSDRGFLVKQVGELGGLTDEITGDWTVDFTVSNITVDFQCTNGFAEAPKNGHFVALEMQINTHPAWDSALYGDFMMNPYDFQVFDANNMRVNDPIGSSYMCLDASQQVPNQIGPSQSVAGVMVFDVPTPTGVIAYSPTIYGAGGWEWAY